MLPLILLFCSALSTTTTAVTADTADIYTSSPDLKDMSDEELVREALKELQKIKGMMGLV